MFLLCRHLMDCRQDRFEDASLICFKKGKLVAVLPVNREGDAFFGTTHVAHAQYICATDKGNALSMLDVLFDHLLQAVFKEKRFFDFGISYEANEVGKLNKGILYWKEGFGTRVHRCEVFQTPTKNHLH